MMARRISEIEKRVYDKYPETEKEKDCAQEKQKRNYMREEFKKKLMAEKKEKRQYGAGNT